MDDWGFTDIDSDGKFWNKKKTKQSNYGKKKFETIWSLRFIYI